MLIARKPGRKAGRTAVAPKLFCLEDRWVPSTLFVDDDKQQIRNAQYTSIQAAVTASHAGDRIVVAPGTYAEQVTIPADPDRITLTSLGANNDRSDDDR